tara:strand:+ start:388 stop:576 length:189 start_codon:yes stop_codon:yes gene_type:complete
MEIVLTFAVLAASATIISIACVPFENASRWLGRDLSAGVRGATINAVGSSLPELFVTQCLIS